MKDAETSLDPFQVQAMPCVTHLLAAFTSLRFYAQAARHLATGGTLTWKTRREYDLMMKICLEYIRPAELELLEDIAGSLDEASAALQVRRRIDQGVDRQMVALSGIVEKLCGRYMCEGEVEGVGTPKSKGNAKKGASSGKKGGKKQKKGKKGLAKADL